MFGVQAFVANAKSLDRLSAEDVLVDDLVHIVLRHSAVPDRFGVHDHGRPVFALVKASCLIGANCTLDAAFRESYLEEPMKITARLRITATARVIRFTLVRADKKMTFEFWHFRRRYKG